MNVAILPDTYGHTVYGPNAHSPYVPARMAQQIQRSGVRDVWSTPEVVRGLAESNGGRYWEKDGAVIAEYNNANGRVYLHPISLSPWRVEGIAPETASHMMRNLDRFAGLLGVKALQHSPAYRFITTLGYNRHPEVFARELPTANDGKPIRPRGLVPNFCREIPYSDTKRRNYVHKYDLRAAWLVAARTAPTPYGAVRFTNAKKTIRASIESKTEGYWLVDLTTLPANPAPIQNPGIYSTPIVRAALDRGQPLNIESGWHWDKQATALRPTCDKLVHVLAAAPDREMRDLCRQFVKLMYTRGLGSLERESRQRPWQHQPHWYYAAQGESARRVWKAYDANAGAFAVHTDTLYIVSDSPDPRLANFGKVADTGQPGSWRYEGSCLVTPALISATRQAKDGSEFSAIVRQRFPLEDMSGGVSW